MNLKHQPIEYQILCKLGCLQTAIEGIGDVTGGNGDEIIECFTTLKDAVSVLSDVIIEIKELIEENEDVICETPRVGLLNNWEQITTDEL